MKRLAPMMLALLALSGCGSSKPAADLYVMRVADDAVTAACGAPGQTLLIERPTARNEYDSKRMAILLGKNHLTYYTGAAWASPFPDQLHAFLSDAFIQSNLLTIVDDSADQKSPSLQLTIREANVVGVDAPVVHLRLSGNITNAAGRVTNRFIINERVPAEANHMAEIVDAYDKAAANAAQKILKTIKPHCLRAVQEYP